MTDQVGKIEQLTNSELDQMLKELDQIIEAYGPVLSRVEEISRWAKLSLSQNTRIRQLEAQLAECERRVFARIREKGYVVVPSKHQYGYLITNVIYCGEIIGQVESTPIEAIDQDEIEREVMG